MNNFIAHTNNLHEGVVSISTNSYMFGNGVLIGNKLLTAAHVIAHSDNFWVRGEKRMKDSAIGIRDTDYWYKRVLCRLSLFKYGWNYDDFAIYDENTKSPFTLSPELPSINDVLETYSIKHEVEQKTPEKCRNIFTSTSKEYDVFHIDKAKVLYIRGNFIFCEMNGMLEKGRSGCPLIKDNKVYGILRGGDDKKKCWFQSSVSILKSFQKQGITI